MSRVGVGVALRAAGSAALTFYVMAETHELAIIGRIRKPHGIAGEMTVELLTAEPERLFAPGARVFAGTVEGTPAAHPSDRRNPESRHELRVQSAFPFRGGLVVKFDAVPDRTAAEQWRGRYLLVPAEELTPLANDEVFAHDLIGMAVKSDDGADVGAVAALYELPQGLTLDVKLARGGSNVLVPYRPEVVREVDLDARVITVDSESGLFE